MHQEGDLPSGVDLRLNDYDYFCFLLFSPCTVYFLK